MKCLIICDENKLPLRGGLSFADEDEAWRMYLKNRGDWEHWRDYSKKKGYRCRRAQLILDEPTE